MKIKLILILMITFQFDSHAEDCLKLTKAELFNEAEKVFLGDVLSIVDSVFEVRVIEGFKGVVEGDTLKGILTENLFRMTKNSTWLLYGRDLDGRRLIIDECSGSKSFDHPYGYHDVSSMRPPSPEILKSDMGLELFEHVSEIAARSEMYYEINSLRYQKAINTRKGTLNKIDIIGGHLANIELKVLFLTLLFVFIVILQVLNIILLFRLCKISKNN